MALLTRRRSLTLLGGLGLGLSIVRTLVTSELMGTITIERGPGDGPRPGTIVRLDLPAAVSD